MVQFIKTSELVLKFIKIFGCNRNKPIQKKVEDD